MEIPVIGMCDGAMYASYEGWYGEGGERIPDRRSNRVGRRRRRKEREYLCIFGGRNLGVVEAGGEVRGGVRVRNIGLTDRLSASDRVCYKGRPGPVERRSEVKGRRREWVEGVVVRGS